ncbi:MAG: hypothetical protein HY513_00265 [Candidatus Aenigmarchaeota archaeon]|nr:hypothetical protein [Candidatus Aenigmarchaeota archaeon]
MENKKTMAIIMILLVGLIFFAGCTGSASTIKSPEQASEAVSDVSTDVEDVTSALQDIDQKLG